MSLGTFSSFCVVGCGGFLGAGARFLVGRVLLHHFPNALLPVGTLTVNLVGCFLIGALSAALAAFEPNRMTLQLFLITGVLGGFTTFSAFGFELFALLKKSDYLALFAYVAASVIGGLFLAILGWKLVTAIIRT